MSLQLLGSWIKGRVSDPYSESGSASRKAKMKCWMLSFESWRLFFQLKFFSNFWSSKPCIRISTRPKMLDTDPDPYPNQMNTDPKPWSGVPGVRAAEAAAGEANFLFWLGERRPWLPPLYVRCQKLPSLKENNNPTEKVHFKQSNE